MLDAMRPVRSRLLYGPASSAEEPRTLLDVVRPPLLDPLTPWRDLVDGLPPVRVWHTHASTRISFGVQVGADGDWDGFSLTSGEAFALVMAQRDPTILGGTVALAQLIEVQLSGDGEWLGHVLFEVQRARRLEDVSLSEAQAA